ncbi:MAG TPA: hypothetical protein VGL44_08030 [Gaiellales bacterium]|jgi:hypothetical protein
MVETFAVAVVGGLTGSACGAGILMWARHRERDLDLEERARDEMAAEANTFAGAAAAAQGLLTAAKWEGLRKDRDDLFGRMMDRHNEMAARLPRIHSAFGSSSQATSAAVRVNEELEACLRHLYGVYDAVQRGEDVDEEWDALEAEERELSAWRSVFGDAARAELLANGNGRVRI